ncbi:proteasome assembly chaperone 1 [Ixodes scapularis]|uniref:Proteasome assembly chaperone 1 n=2 Tax=Ixodes TaxID=6944 RepID=B7PC91_IXOSC|nr:proteasome assembly chaperone 1 [Ixodes scapularis]EEC04213.1 proteasome assembly chaperone, putative [Ixodes scapularis]|eukprot:XP_002409500.1 proteasome assembly chaperone, putative [Ixodes scapularis]
MATFFGEVLPIHSRAVDDNEDENVETPSVFFDLDSKYDDVSSLPAYDLVCVATGAAPNIFAQCYLLPDSYQVLGSIRLNASRHDASDPSSSAVWGLDYMRRPDTLGKLLHYAGHGNGVLYCVCEKEVPPENCAAIARHFVQLSKSTNVTSVSFTALPASEYKSKGRPEFPLLRQLRTCSFKSGPEETVPDLETPNTVSGLSAAMLTECEVGGMSGVLYVLYCDTAEVDSSVVRALEPALKLPCLQALSQPVESCRIELLRRVRDSRIDRGNLYF